MQAQFQDGSISGWNLLLNVCSADDKFLIPA
jgi:hypothetical protein